MATPRSLFRSLIAALALFGAPSWAQGLLGPALEDAFVEAAHSATRVTGGALEAACPDQEMVSSFGNDGVRIRGTDTAWSLSLALASFGRDGARRTPQPVEPVARGRRIEYRRGPLTEWYVNDGRGLEQGFTFAERPAGSGPLEIELAVDAAFSVEVCPGGRDARFTENGSGRVLHYAGLHAWDSTERELVASLAVEGQRLMLRVDDEAAVYPLDVDPWITAQEKKLVPINAQSMCKFGSAVALSGERVLVGAYHWDPSGLHEAGAAFVFVRSGTTWTQEDELTASDAAEEDSFGAAVALAGDIALVTAPSEGGTPGAVYAFERNGTNWIEVQKLVASDGQIGDGFGAAVALSGDTAVIGAPGVAGDSGAAYVFVRSGATWVEQQKVTGSDSQPSDKFGGAVAVSGDTVLVGATYVSNELGAAYVFVRNGTSWSQQQKLNGDFEWNELFGWSVALEGDLASIGARGDEFQVPHGSGSVHVFARNGTSWTKLQKLMPSEYVEDFGCSVAISGDRIWVGAVDEELVEPDGPGTVYLFARNGAVWEEQLSVLANNGASGDEFGDCLAFSGDTLVVGAPRVGTNHGAAYVFRVDPGAAASYCTAGTSASGCQALLAAAGTASASAPSGFSLQATSVEGGKDGLFFWGTDGQQANPWGNGSSYQCVVPPLTRGGLLPGSGTLGACDGSLAQDLNALWCPACPQPQKSPGAGATVWAQLWYRDPFSTSNQPTSFSDAIEFSVEP